MKRKYTNRFLLFVLFMLTYFMRSGAQLAYSLNGNASQLVQNLLGQGLTFSNATLNCGGNASSTFTYTPNASLPYTSGVILATGRINGTTFFGIPQSYAINTAAVNLMSDETTPNHNDAVLNTLATNPNRNDCCVLDFDFVPLGDTVKFNYVFGSEEYPEYVCSEFNDVFGFFVSGPNPGGGSYTSRNIALVPGTTLPVAINTVNPGVPGSASGGGSCTSLAYSSYYYDNASSPYIVFDGLTRSLTASVAVVPCQTYHLKLGVEDIGDEEYDSGVFLQGGSLTSNSTRILSRVGNNSNGNSNAAEGCDTGYIQFKINQRPANTTIHYTIGGTAANGVDYQHIADSVSIAAGDTSAIIPIVTIPDGITEGTETIKVYLLGQCSTSPIDSVTIYLYDQLNLQLGATQTICRGTSATLSPTVTGGSGHYIYSWTPSGSLSSSTVQNPVAAPSDTTEYILTLSDSIVTCTVTDSVRVNVHDCNALVVSVDKDTVCPGTQVQLSASLFRSGFSHWTGNVSNDTIQNPSAIVNSTQTYVYSVTRQDGTTLTDSVTVRIDTTARVNAGANVTQCDTEMVTLTATPSGNRHTPYQYVWTRISDGSAIGYSQTVSFMQTTSIQLYAVTLTGGYCTATDTVIVTTYDCNSLSVSADRDTVCPGTLVHLSGSLYRAGYSLWATTGANTLSDSTAQTTTTVVNATQTYSYSVTQTDGSVLIDSITIYIDTSLRISLGNDITQCDSSVTLSATVSGNYNGFQYLWGSVSNPAISSGTATASPINKTITQASGTTQTYFVVISNTGYGNCEATDSVNVTIGNLQAATSETEISCYGASDGQITVSANGTPPFQYSIDNGNTFTSDSSFNNLSAGTYSIQAKDAGGCVADLSVQVTEPQQGIAVINPSDTAIQLGEPITLNGSISPYSQSSIVSYQWTPSEGLSCTNCANPTVLSYQSDNEYQLTIIYNDVCKATATATVLVSGSGDVFIPNVFSPNGDGNNDVFQIYGKAIKSAQVKIFNRWGEKVFDCMGSSFAVWDGTFRGVLQPPAVYAYEADIVFLNGTAEHKAGAITLLR